METAHVTRSPLRYRIGRKLKGRRWEKSHRPLYRIGSALTDSRGWWDWGAWLMCLFGRAEGGSTYGPPEPRAWYWYEDGHKPRRWGRTWRSRVVIVKSYDAYRAKNAEVELAQEAWRERHPVIGQRPLTSIDTWIDVRKDMSDDDRFPEPPYWHYFNVQDDGSTLIAGNVYGEKGGTNYGLSRVPARWLVRYIVVEWWLKANWLGLRPWLYYRGLHRRVDGKRAFRCNARPEPGSGGYSHWACQQKRRHKGEHRFNNYLWDSSTEAQYAPPVGKGSYLEGGEPR